VDALLFLWGLGGLLLALVVLLLLPLRLSSELLWPGASEAEVRLGRLRLARWGAAGPQLPRMHVSGGGGGRRAPSPAFLWAADRAFFAALRGAPVERARLSLEGGVGDPAVSAVLSGLAWSVLGPALAARAGTTRLEIHPWLEGPAGGRLKGSVEVRVTPARLMAAGLRAYLALRRHRADEREA